IADADRHHATGAHTGHAVETFLELLGRVIGAAHDHDVLGATADVELAVAEEAEVAGVEPAAVESGASAGAIAEIFAHDGRATGEDASVAKLEVDAGKRRADADQLAPAVFQRM